MQRKATRQSRGADKRERDFHDVVSCLPCCWCGNDPYWTQIDHVVGSACKQKTDGATTHIGHWFVLPACVECHKKQSRNRWRHPITGERITKTDLVGKWEWALGMASKFELVDISASEHNGILRWGGFCNEL